MTHKQKIDYMRIAAGICGFGFTEEQLDLLMTTYDKLLATKGKTTISDMVDIQVQCANRAETAKKKEIRTKIVAKKA
jgi:hypothetical protein